jgi:hypothetical protein
VGALAFAKTEEKFVLALLVYMLINQDLLSPDYMNQAKAETAHAE